MSANPGTAARTGRGKPAQSTATIGFEAKLWLAADKLRNNRCAVVLCWHGAAAEKEQP